MSVVLAFAGHYDRLGPLVSVRLLCPGRLKPRRAFCPFELVLSKGAISFARATNASINASSAVDTDGLGDHTRKAPVKRDVKIGRATHFMHFEENRFDLYEETRTFLDGEKARRSDTRAFNEDSALRLVAQS